MGAAMGAVARSDPLLSGFLLCGNQWDCAKVLAFLGHGCFGRVWLDPVSQSWDEEFLALRLNSRIVWKKIGFFKNVVGSKFFPLKSQREGKNTIHFLVFDSHKNIFLYSGYLLTGTKE